MKIHLLPVLVMTSLTVLLLRCSDPASANKETLVRTLQTLPNIAAGEYTYYWDGKNDNGDIVPAGVYLIRLITENHCELRKATVLK